MYLPIVVEIARDFISNASDMCVCVYPFTREGGLLLSGGAWDPKWCFEFDFFHMLFFKFELKSNWKDTGDPTKL